MCSSSPMRTPKLQLAADRRMLDSTKKRYHVQGQRRSPNKKAGGTQSHLESNPTPARDPLRSQTKSYAQQDLGKGAMTPQETEPDLPLSV